jgi:hypothetical protein
VRLSVRQWTLSPILLLLMACAEAPSRQNNPLPGGERAIDESRGLQAPEYGARGNNTGTWGGQQLPNIPAAPRL